MDKKHGAARAENEVWFTREIAALETIAEAEAGHQLTDYFFGFCVMAADARHIAGPICGCQSVAGGSYHGQWLGKQGLAGGHGREFKRREPSIERAAWPGWFRDYCAAPADRAKLMLKNFKILTLVLK